MRISETTREAIALVKMLCPACNTEATFQLFKQKSKDWYIIMPWFSTKYFATCGNCFTTFRMPKELGQDTERTAKRPASSVAIKPEDKVLICSRCGAVNAIDNRFCGNCGAGLMKLVR